MPKNTKPKTPNLITDILRTSATLHKKLLALDADLKLLALEAKLIEKQKAPAATEPKLPDAADWERLADKLADSDDE